MSSAVLLFQKRRESPQERGLGVPELRRGISSAWKARTAAEPLSRARGPREPSGAFTGRLFSTGCRTRAGNIPDHPRLPVLGREARGAGHAVAVSRLDQALRFLVIRARLAGGVFLTR